MNLKTSTLAAAALMLALAGCMEKLPSQWGFRYEDRDKVMEAADKLEALATNLYMISRRPVDYSARPESAGMNAIRFFAAEAARFHRSARAWQPGSTDIGYAYTNLSDRWGALRNDTGTLQAHEQARAYIQRINELMQDLGRLTTRNSPAVTPRGPAATGPAKPAEPKAVESLVAVPAPTRQEPAVAPVPVPAAPIAKPSVEPALFATPRVQPASEAPPAMVPTVQTAPPQPPQKPAPAPQPPTPAAPTPAPEQPTPPTPPAPKPPPEEKPPLLPPLSPIAPNPGLR